MGISTIVSMIDKEIAALQEARSLLAGTDTAVPKSRTKRGRPVGSGKKITTLAPTKRTLSPEAKARIAAAQKKRWALARKAAA